MKAKGVMYREATNVLSERAEGARTAIAEIDRERGVRARELAAIEQRLGAPPSPLWPRVRPLVISGTLVVLAAATLLQTARVEMVSRSTSTSVQLYLGSEPARLHASYE